MACSKYTMPIIVLNLGGEMIYILNQRLQAQNVVDDKARKVLQDVGRAMFSSQFLAELFKPQDTYSISSTKQIFEKLAHSSIMRLNKSSMDKLFDLMIMGFKYQLLQCSAPQHYLHVTLNHLETIKEMMGNESASTLVQGAIIEAIKLYSTFNQGQWLRLKKQLMSFIQGKRVKVSLFLQYHMQSQDGTIAIDGKGRLPYGTEIPGIIRIFEGNRIVHNRDDMLDVDMQYSESGNILETDSTLGMNMYLKDFKPGMKYGKTINASIDATRSLASDGFAKSDFKAQSKVRAIPPNQRSGVAASSNFNSITSSSAKAELNMLADLLGMGSPGGGSKEPGPSDDGADSKGTFRIINLFPESSGSKWDSKGDDSSSGMIVLDIDAAADAKSLQSYLDQLDFHDEPKSQNDRQNRSSGSAGSKGLTVDDDDDLLALMDSAK